jgi:hypothetical protein
MHPRQPSPRIKHPHPLPKEHKRQQRHIINHQHRRENPSDNHRIPAHRHPIEQIQPESKTNPALAQTLRNHQLGSVGSVAVHCVRESESEVEVTSPVYHGDAGEETDPVEVQVGRHSVDYQTCGGDYHGREEDTEAHFGFADVVVALC